MNKYWSLIFVVLIWGFGSGFGLKYSVPLMKGIKEDTLILLSSAIPIMFMPSALVHAWRFPIWWTLIIQLSISLIAAPVSGYFMDTITSYLLLGVVSLVIVYIATFFSNEIKTQILISYLLSFFTLTGLNIYGHHITDNGMTLTGKIVLTMTISYSLCFVVTTRVSN